jgi:hypothetical protein
MRIFAAVVPVIVLSLIAAGCSEKKKGTMPPELPALAAQFKAAPGGDAKIQLAKKIMTLLPTCTRQGGDANMAVIDLSNPTYVLKAQEIYALLGNPLEADPNGESCVYDLGKGEKANFYLLVELYSGYVSSARIDAGK